MDKVEKEKNEKQIDIIRDLVLALKAPLQAVLNEWEAKKSCKRKIAFTKECLGEAVSFIDNFLEELYAAKDKLHSDDEIQGEGEDLGSEVGGEREVPPAGDTE